MATIEITWVLLGFTGSARADALPQYKLAYPDAKDEVTASFEFELGAGETDKEFCERVFANTNQYEGAVWDALQPALPEDRPHTALSVGDRVTIDGRSYRCESLGFAPIPSKMSA